MKYIIMCGGEYPKWKTPRQLVRINDETIVERTIRLLSENWVKEIYISSNNPVFEQFGEVLHHENSYNAVGYDNFTGYWTDAFYPTDDPVCYIFGDVIFSPAAIKTIVETQTDDIEFFGSKPPFAPEYLKKWAEPFALKVVNTDHLKQAIEETKRLHSQGKFNRKPIMWELWQVITGGKLNHIDYSSYVGINDYTCDIDNPEEIIRVP